MDAPRIVRYRTESDEIVALLHGKWPAPQRGETFRFKGIVYHIDAVELDFDAGRIDARCTKVGKL